MSEPTDRSPSESQSTPTGDTPPGSGRAPPAPSDAGSEGTIVAPSANSSGRAATSRSSCRAPSEAGSEATIDAAERTPLPPSRAESVVDGPQDDDQASNANQSQLPSNLEGRWTANGDAETEDQTHQAPATAEHTAAAEPATNPEDGQSGTTPQTNANTERGNCSPKVKTSQPRIAFSEIPALPLRLGHDGTYRDAPNSAGSGPGSGEGSQERAADTPNQTEGGQEGPKRRECLTIWTLCESCQTMGSLISGRVDLSYLERAPGVFPVVFNCVLRGTENTIHSWIHTQIFRLHAFYPAGNISVHAVSRRTPPRGQYARYHDFTTPPPGAPWWQGISLRETALTFLRNTPRPGSSGRRRRWWERGAAELRDVSILVDFPEHVDRDGEALKLFVNGFGGEVVWKDIVHPDGLGEKCPEGDLPPDMHPNTFRLGWWALSHPSASFEQVIAAQTARYLADDSRKPENCAAGNRTAENRTAETSPQGQPDQAQYRSAYPSHWDRPPMAFGVPVTQRTRRRSNWGQQEAQADLPWYSRGLLNLV
ncbi:uncharacterized protein BJX67DRAFT_382307 [Aspergillus lucknowensis]|uniref:Uncharacterized protein n=1 Tax=Aspergillus lucknowensis TaxID=176173 RepID=A0ABR4LN10_9EURO